MGLWVTWVYGQLGWLNHVLRQNDYEPAKIRTHDIWILLQGTTLTSCTTAGSYARFYGMLKNWLQYFKGVKWKFSSEVIFKM